MNEKLTGMLGLCKKAGKLSPGHDAAFESIRTGKACVCFLCRDASDRLKSEFLRTCSFEGRNVKVCEAEFTSPELYAATGIKAAVFTINEEGFAKKILKIYGGNV